MKERTLCLVKPNAVAAGHIGEIVARFEKEGLTLAGLKFERLSRERAEAFYAEHRGKPFFEGLVSFMTSGPIVAVLLEGEKAVERCRAIMGATDPVKAAPGTLRALYGESTTRNAVHGSDGPASAAREIAFFFAETE